MILQIPTLSPRYWLWCTTKTYIGGFAKYVYKRLRMYQVNFIALQRKKDPEQVLLQCVPKHKVNCSLSRFHVCTCACGSAHPLVICKHEMQPRTYLCLEQLVTYQTKHSPLVTRGSVSRLLLLSSWIAKKRGGHKLFRAGAEAVLTSMSYIMHEFQRDLSGFEAGWVGTSWL